MKRNIDLTLKRDFNNVKNNDVIETVSRLLRLRIWGKKEIPWRTTSRLINIDATHIKDSEMAYDNILITGNKTKRAKAKFYRKTNENICECCGKPLDYIPWKIKYGLCEKCSITYPNELDNIVWRNKTKFKQNSERVCWR